MMTAYAEHIHCLPPTATSRILTDTLPRSDNYQDQAILMYRGALISIRKARNGSDRTKDWSMPKTDS